MNIEKIKAGSCVFLIIWMGVSMCGKIDKVRKMDRELKEMSQAVKEIRENTVMEHVKTTQEHMVGYLYIPGTNIDFPIMQSGMEEPDYYLTHNIDGKYSSIGTPYLSAYCTPGVSDNDVIYGHNISGGRVFGELLKYQEKTYCQSHKYISFYANEQRTYEIFGVMRVNIREFPYDTFVLAKDKEDYEAFCERVKKNSLYECEATPNYGHSLLTLSTCDNSREKDARFVVVAVEQ